MFYAAVHKISPNPDLPWEFVGTDILLDCFPTRNFTSHSGTRLSLQSWQ